MVLQVSDQLHKTFQPQKLISYALQPKQVTQHGTFMVISSLLTVCAGVLPSLAGVKLHPRHIGLHSSMSGEA